MEFRTRIFIHYHWNRLVFNEKFDFILLQIVESALKYQKEFSSFTTSRHFGFEYNIILALKKLFEVITFLDPP